MKIAIISDIHGNMQALEAVLADIEKENCDKIFCLGDLAMAGPEPVKTVEKIKSLYEEGKLELIQGNTDEMIGNYNEELAQKVKNAAPIMGNALENDVKIIPDNLKEFLKNLPAQKELEIEGLKVLLVHGSPRKNDENILPDLPIEKVEEMLTGTDADIIFCGHTHIPCGYQTQNKQTIVNDGSVGRPFTQEPKACYVVAEFYAEPQSKLDSINHTNYPPLAGGSKSLISGRGKNTFEIQHKFIDYDRQKASEILAKRDFEGADKLAQHLIRPESRHM